MKRTTHVVCTGLCLWLGCGGAQSNRESTATIRVDANARELAPDLASRVDQAAHDAQHAQRTGDNAAERDHAQRAELWSTALNAEAERIGLDRERENLMREIETIESARMVDEAARVELEQATRRQQAAAIARAEAARMLTEAESDEARRRGGDAARIETRRDASRALLDRSAMVVAAATALGADASTTEAATRAIDAARTKLDGSAASMRATQDAFRLAHAALGQARARRPGATAQELDALLEALTAEGIEAEATDDGVVIWLADAFVNGRAELKTGGKVMVERLAALLTAHPHGPIQLHAITSAAVPPAIAKRRNQSTRAALGPSLGDRVSEVQSQVGGDHANLVRLSLPAYGCAQLPAAGVCASRSQPAQAQTAP